MNPHTIGKIDRLLGNPTCFVLTLVRRIGALFGGGRAKEPVRKILFIKMIEQGATVLASAAMQRAIEKVGRENIYFWVFEENRPILDLMGMVPPENVLVIRAKKPIRLALDMLATLRKVRKLGIDATVDMEFYARAPAILAFLTGASRRVGLHRFTSEGPYRGDLLTHRMQYNPYLHTAYNYYNLVDALWTDPAQWPMLKTASPTVDAAPPKFRTTEAERQTVQGIMDRLADKSVEAPVVLLNPNASDLLPLRKWATECFVELGQRILRENEGATIFITGAPSEREAAEKVAGQIGGRCFSTAGHTTLRQLMVLYDMADILVTNDSGPGHFSSMTDIDTIVLFGPETPALYGPLGPRSHVIWKNLSCSPCVNVLNHRFSPCNNNVCMQQITVDEVYAMVSELLAKRAKNAVPLPVVSEVHA